MRDIVLIESAALEFAPGLNVLTGETGAGKSILLDALGLLRAGRGGGRAAVRPGAAQGSATAVFEPGEDHRGPCLACANRTCRWPTEIVLRRTLASDGRTRAFVNDEPVGVALQKDLGAMLLEIHGQTDDRGLFDVSTHRVLLDAFAGNEPLAREAAARFAVTRRGATRLKPNCAAWRADRGRGRRIWSKQPSTELSALAPEEGEEAVLTNERVLLMNAAKIAEDVAAASDSLSGERGAENSLAVALKRLSRMNESARPCACGGGGCARTGVRASRGGAPRTGRIPVAARCRPRHLERKEERLFALRAAARKYGVQPDALPRVLADFQVKYEAIGGGDAGLRKASASGPRRRAPLSRRGIEIVQKRGKRQRALLKPRSRANSRRSSSAMRNSGLR